MRNPKISVIVPIYNVEPYLIRGLDSVLQQTLSDIEIICVNDGSTDNSLKILEKYKAKDKRIKIINKENGGVSSARNAGIEIAKGDYLYMFDPDDWIENNMLEVLYNKIIKNNSDIVECDYIEHKNVKIDKISKRTLKIKENLFTKLKIKLGFNYSANDIKKHIFSIRASSCNKLFRREFIEKNNTRFMNVGTEDYYFCLECFLCAKNISYINKYLYHYCIRPKSYSTMQSKNEEININTKNICTDFNLIKDILERTNKFNEYSKEFNKYEVQSLTNSYLYIKKQIKILYQSLLSDKDFNTFNQIIENDGHTFLQKIFFVSTQRINGVHYKEIIFCGYKLFLKID